MDKIQLRRVKAHWRQLIAKADHLGSIEDISEDIGKSKAYLRNMLSNDAMPGVDVILALAGKLSCTANDLLSLGAKPVVDSKEIADIISRQVSRIMTERIWGPNGAPSGHDIMQWWLANGGRLENYDFIDESFDLFEVPDGTHRHIIPHKLGARSLASTELRTTSLDVYHRTVRPLPQKYRNLILVAQKSSAESGPVTTMETLDTLHPDTGEEIKIEYARTFAPVQMRDGKTLILNYSKLFRETGEISGGVSQVSAT